MRTRGGPPAMALRLPDGRWLVARRTHGEHGFGWLLLIAALAAAIGVGAYPVARRITRRLEKLRAEVEELGAGDLRARASVEGSDEVAALARSFNRAAARIESLVSAQRGLLASASHELRSPLARMRMAVELLAGDARPELRERVEKDIDELDDLIGEILLASRLDAQVPVERPEGSTCWRWWRRRRPARMRRRAASRCACAAMRACCAAWCATCSRTRGDTRPGQPWRRACEPAADGVARLRVEDRGPGVPEAERERIFEPWYRPAGLSESGAGLGLALVRQIARHHGGEARYLPREGGGSCFEVELATGEQASSSLASASGFSPRR